MKLWNLATFLTISILTFSGCVESPTPKDKPVVDSTLPIVTLTKTGIFTDMKAVGFEWHNITDPRVKGIYIFKQTLNKEESKLEYYDTIKNRFVTHYIDRDVEPQTAYNYSFKTYSSNSESKMTPIIEVKTSPILNSVSWIYVVQSMPRSAKIIWRPHTNGIVKTYIIERKTLVDGEWKELVRLDGRLNAEYIDKDLKDNFVYKYRIKVLTYNNIISKPSQEVKVVTKQLPMQIENIVATKTLPKKIEVTWNATKIPDFSHYNIYRAENIDDSYDLIKTTKETKYIDDIDEDGKDYFYRISVIDNDDLESKHDVRSIHGKTLTKPITPSLVELKYLDNALEISWKSTDKRATSFVVSKRAQKSWMSENTDEFVDIKGNTFVDSKVEPETTYYYTVYSVDKFGIRSQPSIEVEFKTNKNQGKIIVQTKSEDDEDSKKSVNVNKKPSQDTDVNVVKPMEDIDMSEL
jgi:fibronectin type 3 domain-containing protein